MGAREKLASGVAPFFLRLALGVTFVWAGAGKLFVEEDFKGAEAAALANMGVAITPTKTGGAMNTPPAARPSPATPASPAPAAPSQPQPVPDSKPTMLPPMQPLPPGEGPKGGRADAGGWLLLAMTAQPPAPRFSAEDFPEPVRLRRVYRLALLVSGWAKIPPEARNRFELWPPMLAEGERPVYVAFAAALTELVAGALVLVGMMTRLASLALAFMMVSAAWLTQIGPAIQADKVTILFLPDRPWYDEAAWAPLLLQFVLFMAALALFFAGPGGGSFDQLMSGGNGGEKPARKAAPKEE